MIEGLWYGRDFGSRAGRALLSPLSSVFAVAAALRGSLYDRRLLRAVEAGVPVVSVGGLSVGGAGKTPFVMWLVERLRSEGWNPCVLTRGYGGSARLPLLLNVEGVPWPAEAVAAAGDEAVLIALRTGAPVAVAADRGAGARLARQHCSPDIFVLDDGFQHRRLARDLDIVLVSGAEHEQRLLPAGPLRERPAALRRAHVVVRTNGDSAGLSADCGTAVLTLSTRVRATGVVGSGAFTLAQPNAAVGVRAQRLARKSEVWGLELLKGRRIAAVAAIARPERFVAALQELGASVVETLLLRDHHAYDAGDWTRIAALRERCELVVTTEKDMVKLAGLRDGLAGAAEWLVALRVEPEVEGADALLERIGGLDRKAGSTHHPPTFARTDNQ